MSDDDRRLLGRQNDAGIVRGKLAEASRRIRTLRALSRGARFAFLAHVILGPWLLFRGWAPLPSGLYLLALTLVTLAGAIYGLLAPLPAAAVARLLDDRLALKERIQSALEVTHRHGHPVVDALLRDAATAVGEARLPAAFPVTLPPEARHVLAALAVVSVLFLLPPLPIRLPGSTDFRGSPGAEEEGSPPSVAEASRPDSRNRASSKDPRAQDRREDAHGQPGRIQAWDELAAIFKDTAIGSARPDFSRLLKGGDERLKMLAPSATFPDLQGDYTQSPSEAQTRRVEATLRQARPGKPSAVALERLMDELKSLDRRSGQQGPSGERKSMEDFTAKEGGPLNRRLEALERALSRFREKGASHGEGGHALRPAPEQASGVGDQGDDEGSEEPDGPRQEGREKGSRPGRTPSPHVRDRPTPRIDTGKLDTALAGQAREGEQETYDTNLAGVGAKSPSRLPYLDLLTQYRQMAEEALSKERVPFSYREQVKVYFKSLEQ